MSKKLVLIDGHSILNRAFFGLPDLTNSEGMHTGAVLGFLNIILKILEEEQPDYLTVAFDVKHPTFRHEMFAEYKGTRKPMANELREQVPLMKEVLHAMGVTTIERPGYEADDILGTIAQIGEGKGYEVSVISGDRDLLQLATEKVKIRIPKTKRTGTEIEDYYSKDVQETYQVTPQEFIDLKALMGDASDNIPGVPGIGEKTATKIITKYHSIENAYEHVEELTPNKAKTSMKEHYDMAQLSKSLATIKTDCELEYNIEDATFEQMFNEESYKMFKRLEFKNLLNRFNTSESAVNVTNEAEQYFTCIESLKEARKKIAQAVKSKETHIGFQLLTDGELLDGMSICYSATDCYYIKIGDYIKKKDIFLMLKELADSNKTLVTIRLKEQCSVIASIRTTIEKKDTDLYEQTSLFDTIEQDVTNATEEETLPSLLSCINEEKCFDLGVAAYLLNPLKDTYNYDDIARDYLQMTVPSKADLFGKVVKIEEMKQQEKEFLTYVGYNGYVNYASYEPMVCALKEAQMLKLFEQIEMPLVYVLYEMEDRGIRVNKEALQEYGESLAGKISELEQKIYEEVDETFNINSPKQLGVILFEKLRLPFAKKTKTGYSTSAEILEKLRCEHEVIGMILEYRQLTKLKSTYADGLAAYIKEDGRIHGKFNQTITATGRISSTEPNLQNIPIRMELGRQIRKVFIPEDGYIFLDADYSQIELRVLAHMSEDKRLIQAYKEDQDIHRITASEVFHTPLEEVTSSQRSNAKAVNFGIVYGISAFSLGQDLNITKKEADTYIEKYFETYPRVKHFLEELVEYGKEQGYVTTLLNRRRPIPELVSSNFMQREFGKRVAMNSPIQGSAADIIKIAMINVNKMLKEKHMKSRLILQIHDELLIETKKEEVEEVTKLLVEEMEHAIQLQVPLDVDVNTGVNWYEVK